MKPAKNTKTKLTLLVDFDGVLHSYKSGWKGASNIPDPPVDGAIRWLQTMLERFDVAIYSTRSLTPEGVQAMRVALTEWAKADGMGFQDACDFVEKLRFPEKKEPAWLTIDDRCICFTGTFPTLEEVYQFQPWYRR
jgi:hypothetical protein